MALQGADPKTVTSTFLFTDVEGSTRFWVEQPEQAGAAFARHDRLLTEAVTGCGGAIVKGIGDGFMAVFDSPLGAVTAAIEGQLALKAERDRLGGAARVRMAISTGEAEFRDGDYYGLTVILCSRLTAAAHGGQILMTGAARGVIDRLPEPADLIDLGEHRLRDLELPERVFQVSHPELAARFPTIRALPSVRHNLPAQLTSFVGRATELRRIGELLQQHRLVTLTGSGGVGKTRLAIRAAFDGVEAYPDGVWLVELDAVEDQQLVSRRVADELGVPDRGERTATDLVAGFLEPRNALLVLDNCEHVLAGSADLARTLLGACPDLRVLATSRERLDVRGEVTYRVPSMSVPDVPAEQGVGVAVDFDAARLFVERSALAAPGFRLTAASAPAVAEICRSLDGIPLAIELAAAKIASLSPLQLAERIDDRLHLLGRSGRASVPRHQTLRAAIDWSYGLLDASEQALFGRLAVFRGGFDVPAAEAVCCNPGQRRIEVVSVLLRLVEKSLVVHATDTGRYGMLQTLRGYAEERLRATGEHAAIAARHADYYTELAQAARAEVYGSEQTAWLDRLSVEHDNLRSALRHGIDSGADTLAGRIASAAWPFWRLRGHISEGRDWMTRILEASDRLDPALLIDALLGAGALAIDQGDLSEGGEFLDRARTLAETTGDVRAAAAIIAKMAPLPYSAGDIEAAISLGEEALAMAVEAGDDLEEGRILPSLALFHEDVGNHDRAEALATRAVELGHRSDNPYLVCDAALSAGEIALNRDDHEAAERRFGEVLRNAETVGGLGAIEAWALAYLGKLAIATGHPRRAHALLERALGEFRDQESPMGVSWTLSHLGRALQAEGDLSAARRRLEEALRLASAYVRPDAQIALEGLGVLAAAAGEADQAAVLLAAAEAMREGIGLRLAAPELRASMVARAGLRAALGDDGLAELTRRGKAMTLDEVVDYVGSG